MGFPETNAHISIDYIPSAVRCCVRILLCLSLALSPLLHTRKRPQSYTIVHVVLLLFSFYSETFFACPPRTSSQRRTAITIITRSAAAAADSVILWHGKKGIRSVRGIDGARFPFSPDGFYF